ncbi:carboxymuconolactone decarboxylase family protein [Candidatus Mycobacterium wuenschmannii]|uniref:Carboxymuconolactone decarboxylase family protein n=1 Tax=Candidatus Mycobacterium wuenschmannii TaxID=3027808 RepID=A0ABY8VY97_9MYCO|nr:carboxymuconolactone decarboxylase family protein [Candidatus Mycobacterium wuenschmannii]WIM88076.1 carboxymuconolactone decarboxylase family protein [Candidatus Mycobacterium wuenschmannii]
MTTTHSVEDTSRYDTAAAVLDDMFGPSWRDKQRATGMKAVDDFQRIAVEHCYTDVWARNTLDRKTRSVACLSILATLGTWDEFKLHVEAALANGWTHEEVMEIVLHLVPYIGVPKSIKALRTAGETFQELFTRDAATS